jgi:hypothetical protein
MAKNTLLKVTASLLGVRFDDLRQRDQERRRGKLKLWIASLAGIAIIFLAMAIYAFLQKGLAGGEGGGGPRGLPLSRLGARGPGAWPSAEAAK